MLLTIVVVGETAGAWESLGVPLVLVHPRPGISLQALRAEGVRQAATPFAAVVNPNYYPGAQWLEEALRADDDVTAGCIAPAHRLSWLGWAIYLTEYSRVAPPMREGRLGPEEAWLTPGGNVIYRKDTVPLDAMQSSDRELDFHRRIAGQGVRFVRRPRMIAHFQNRQTFREYCRERWNFSRDLGRARGWRKIAIPAVPFLVPARVAWSVAVRGRRLGRLVLALPLVILIGLVQTAGELRGTFEFR